MDWWGAEEGKKFWAVPGVRGGLALRGFGLCMRALLTLVPDPSWLVPSTWAPLQQGALPFHSSARISRKRVSEERGKGRETGSCSWFFLQSCYTSFREDMKIETHPSSQLKNSLINWDYHDVCKQGGWYCPPFEYLGTPHKVVHAVHLPCCKVWQACAFMVLIACWWWNHAK